MCVHSAKLAETAQNDWRDVGRPQVAMHSQMPHFLVYFYVLSKLVSRDICGRRPNRRNFIITVMGARWIFLPGVGQKLGVWGFSPPAGSINGAPMEAKPPEAEECFENNA